MNKENVYTAPKSALIDRETLSSVDGDKVLTVAKRQRTLIYTFLIYIVLAAITGFVGDDMRPLLQILAIPVALTVVIMTARLCLKVYSIVIAIILIILSFVPLLNILVLLAASSRANKYIKDSGFKVGFLGADVRAIEDALQASLR